MNLAGNKAILEGAQQLAHALPAVKQVHGPIIEVGHGRQAPLAQAYGRAGQALPGRWQEVLE